jgi:hypothetical protein
VKKRQQVRGDGDPHHVNAALANRAPWVRSHLCAGGLRGVATDGRHLGSGKRTSFTGRPRNRSWRPFEHAPCPRKRHGDGRREATGVSEAASRKEPRGKQRPACPPSLGRRSGRRVVNHDAPRPRSHRMAPSQPVPPSCGHARVRCRKGERESRRFSRGRARVARLGMSAIVEKAGREVSFDHSRSAGKRRSSGARV